MIQTIPVVKTKLNKTMTLDIFPEKKIAKLQDQFNETYPYLMLGFFVPGHTKKASNDRISEAILSARTVGDCQKIKVSGLIEIHDSMSVADLEKIFIENFHLQVLVFRKAGNHWLQTNMTNNWSLIKQNEVGREITTAALFY